MNLRYKLAAVGAAAVTATTVAAVPVQAEPPAMIHTRHMVSYDHKDVQAALKTYGVSARVHWNWSNHAGQSAWGKRAWARGTEAYVSINERGFFDICPPLGGWDGMNFRFHFSNPANGHRWVTRRYHLSCSHDTTSGMWVPLNTRRMHYEDPGLPPRWKMTFTILVKNNPPFKNKTGQLSGVFRRIHVL